MTPLERLRHDEERAVWHANLGPYGTPQLQRCLDQLEEIVDANRQDGARVKPAVAVDAYPGLGKTTAAIAFGRGFHRRQVELYGPRSRSGDEHIPVAFIGLTATTTMRSLNSALCRFYAHPGADRGNATQLAGRAAECVLACDTRIIIVDDVHFLDLHRRDGREVANHIKWLQGSFPVTFVFVGVGLDQRGFLREGLSRADAPLAQTARRWTRLTVTPFDVTTEEGRRSWRQLLMGIEEDLVLARKDRGMLADDLADCLFARTTGHFASLMTLITRGCRRAIRTGEERLTRELLDGVPNDEASEQVRAELQAAFDKGRLRARPTRQRKAS